MRSPGIRKVRNKRIYIGPGRDGSSDDKISVDCKFEPRNTKVAFSKTWRAQGFVKTSYAYVETANEGKGAWKLVQDQEDLTHDVNLSELIQLNRQTGKVPKQIG